MKKSKKIKRKSCSREIREDLWKNLTGISHNTTRQLYRNCVNRFVAYCRNTYDCKTAEECRGHIQGYADYLQEQGKSPHTIHTYIAGVCHACRVPMGEIQKPKRVNADNVRGRSFIKRTNYRTDMDLENEQWNRVTEFQKVAGLRRAELQKLAKESLVIDESGYLCLRVVGKGGRLQLQRISTQKAGIETEKEDLIRSYFAGLESGQPVFCKEDLHNKLNLHRLRALKAQRDYADYLHRVQTEPDYREQLIAEIKARWERYNINPRTHRPMPFPVHNTQGYYYLRGDNRKLALKMGLPIRYDRLCVLATSVFSLAHYRLDVSIANYLLAI